MKKSRIIIFLLLFLTACTDQPPDNLSLPSPTPNQIQSTVIASLPAPSTPTPVVVIKASTPEPDLAVDHNIISLPQATPQVQSTQATPPPAPLPKIIGTLPDLSRLVDLTGEPDSSRLLARFSDQALNKQGQVEPLRALALSPDRQWLALADRAQVWVMALSDGKLLKTLYSSSSDPQERGAHSLAWSPDGLFLAAGGLNGLITVWRWDHPTNNFRAGPLRLAPNAMSEAFGDTVEVAFSPDSRLVAGFGSDGTVTVYVADTGFPKGSFTSDYAGYLSWAPDSKRLVDEFFLIHYLDSGRSILPDETVAAAADGPEGIAWSPDGKWLAGSGQGYGLLLVQAPLAPPVGQPAPAASQIAITVKIPESLGLTALPHLREGRRVAWSPDSRWVAVANLPQPGQVSLYNTAGQLLLSLDAGPEPLTSLQFARNSLLLSAGNDGNLRIFQLTGPPLATPTPLINLPTPIPTPTP